jgi:hypothetical protein
MKKTDFRFCCPKNSPTLNWLRIVGINHPKTMALIFWPKKQPEANDI